MKTVRLTEKMAVKLIQRVVPVPGWTIIGPHNDGERVYFSTSVAPSFNLEVVCEDDGQDQNGCIKLTVSDRHSESRIVMYFDPDALERDWKAERRAGELV